MESLFFINGLTITHGYVILLVWMVHYVFLVFYLGISFHQKLTELKYYFLSQCHTGVMHVLLSNVMLGWGLRLFRNQACMKVHHPYLQILLLKRQVKPN